MKVLDRFFVFLFSLLVIALGVVSIFAAFERQYVRVVLDHLLSLGGQGFGWLFLAVGVVLVLLGVIIMITVAFRRDKKKQSSNGSVATGKTESGDVELSAAAVNAIVQHSMAQLSGVKSVGNDFRQTADGLMVSLKITVEGEQNMVALSEQLKAKVREQLEGLGGLKVADVKVTITDVVLNQKAN